MKDQGRGKMRLKERKKRKQKKVRAPAAVALMTAKRKKRKGWAESDMGRVAPGKPSWSGMIPPSPTSARGSTDQPMCSFCKTQPSICPSLSHSPLVSMTGLGRPSASLNLPSMLWALPMPHPWGSSKSSVSLSVGTTGWLHCPCSLPFFFLWAHPESCHPTCRVLITLLFSAGEELPLCVTCHA